MQEKLRDVFGVRVNDANGALQFDLS